MAGLVGLFLLPVALAAADDLVDEALQASQPYRTALHHDPGLRVPLERLLEVYAGRWPDLVGLYDAHVRRYPADGGARAVLVQILQRVEPGRSRRFLAESVAACPQHPYLHYLQAKALRDRQPERARVALLTAVRGTPVAERRRDWGQELVELCARSEDAAALDEALAAWGLADAAIADRLAVAATLLRHRATDALRRVLNEGWPQVGGDQAVQRELLLARAAAADGEREGAAERLDQLLGRLAFDHWQRPELIRYRLALAAKPVARRALLQAWRERADSGGGAAVWLDLARAQRFFGRDEDAQATLRAGLAVLPDSAALEAELLHELEAGLHYDELIDLLGERLARDPSRADLRQRLIWLRLAYGEDAAAEGLIDAWLADVDPDTASERRLALARSLADTGLVDRQVALYDAVLDAWPTRLDILRELLAVLHEADPAGVAHQLSAGRLQVAAPVEQAIDLLRWLLPRGYAAQARLLLEAQLKEEPYHPELLAVAVECYALLEQDGRRQAVLDRLAADVRSPADFRRYVEVRLQGIADEDRPAALLAMLADIEADDQQAWQQRLVVVELLERAGARDMQDRLRELLAAAPDWARPRLRISLVAQLRRSMDAAASKELQEQLDRLRQEDPANEQHHLAELIVAVFRREQLEERYVQHSSRFFARWQAWLNGLAIARLEDGDLLESLTQVFLASGDLGRYRQCLSSLLRQDEPSLTTWERYLSLLLMQRRDDDFRYALRRFLASEQADNLADASRKRLQRAEVASLWRSIARQLDAGATQQELMPLFDQLDALVPVAAERRWTMWLRALLARRAGDAQQASDWLAQLRGVQERLQQLQAQIDAERDDDRVGDAPAEALGEFDGPVVVFTKSFRRGLDQATDVEATASSADDQSSAVDPDWLIFPDGLQVSFAALAHEPQQRPPPPRPHLPLPPYRLRWRQELDGQPLGAWNLGEQTIVSHQNGLIAVDTSTGKRQWQVTSRSPQQPAQLIAGRWYAPALVLGESVLAVEEDMAVVARDAAGEIRWRAPVPPEGHLLFAVDAGMVLAIGQRSRACLALEVATGRRLWENESLVSGVDAQDQPLVRDLSYGAGRLLLDGRRLIDCADGRTLWEQTLPSEPTLPLGLEEKRRPTLATMLHQGIPTGSASGYQRTRGRRFLFSYLDDDEEEVFSYMGQKPLGEELVLVNDLLPTTNSGQPAAQLAGEHMLLASHEGWRQRDALLPIRSIAPGDGDDGAIAAADDFLRVGDEQPERPLLVGVDVLLRWRGTGSLRDFTAWTLGRERVLVVGVDELRVARGGDLTVVGRGAWPAELQELTEAAGGAVTNPAPGEGSLLDSVWYEIGRRQQQRLMNMSVVQQRHWLRRYMIDRYQYYPSAAELGLDAGSAFGWSPIAAGDGVIAILGPDWVALLEADDGDD